MNKLPSLIGPSVLAAAIILLGLHGTGCGGRGYRGTIILSTEDVCISGRGFFVSPDEQWLVLITRDEGGGPAGLSSLNIATGKRADYDPDQFPEKFKEYLNKGVMSFERFNMGLDPGGWFNGQFFIGIGIGRLALSLLPSQPAAVANVLPHEPLMLSDGPDSETRSQVIRDRMNVLSLTSPFNEFLNDDVIAWRDGEWGDALYHYDMPAKEIRLYRPGQPSSTVVRTHDGVMTRAGVTAMRVSPDERFLAYVVWSESKNIPTPFYREALKVIDLKTGEDRTIGQFRYVARPYWSGDSQRLYYSGKEGDLSGVWIVDMKEVFGG